ncbi:GNAT family N-acetyltransferase [Prolixibacteraceae bacterium JC049]|nr:GNAT family N-acetyltransferase [Prolixibacteraceae bacterium JC049]
MNIIIREANINDLNNLTVLKQQVWISTYATEGLIDEFSSYVLSEYSLDNVKKSIQNKDITTLVALCDDCLIGCVEILKTPQKPIKSAYPSIEISTFYILEKFQGQGIGKQLLSECFNQIKQLGYQQVWLTVYYKNQNAIDFYAKQYFKHIGETNFILGEEKHKNYIMLKDI